MRAESQTSRERARLLASLAKELLEMSPKTGRGRREKGYDQGRLTAFRLTIPTHRRYRALGLPTIQWLRRLREAHLVFGDRFEALIVAYGVSKILLLGKLADARSIVRTGETPLTSGEVRPLAKTSAREIEAILRVEEHRKRPGHMPLRLPGNLFRVPEDFQAVERILRDRLKSLRLWDSKMGPRLKMAEIDSPAEESMRNLEVLLMLYTDLIKYARDAHDSVSKAQPPTRTARRLSGHVQGHVVTDKKLCRRLAVLRRSR